MNGIKQILLAALVLFSVTNLWSAEEPAAKSSTAKPVHNYFRFPGVLLPAHAFSHPQPVKVEVLYSTDVSGKVIFVNARTEDTPLKEEIEKQFRDLSLTNVRENVVHKMVLTFRVI